MVLDKFRQLKAENERLRTEVDGFKGRLASAQEDAVSALVAILLTLTVHGRRRHTGHIARVGLGVTGAVVAPHGWPAAAAAAAASSVVATICCRRVEPYLLPFLLTSPSLASPTFIAASLLPFPHLNLPPTPLISTTSWSTARSRSKRRRLSSKACRYLRESYIRAQGAAGT